MAGQQDWIDYWKENMTALGIKPPEGYYATQVAVSSAIGTLVGVVEKFGPRVTVMELIGAGILSEKFLIFSGMLASAYVGAMIGSGAVATQRCLMKGTTLGDVLYYSTYNHWSNQAVLKVIRSNPQIYEVDIPGRQFFLMRRPHFR